MSNLKPYKGYHATLEVDVDAGLIHGRVQGLQDVVSFEVEHPREVVRAFKEAVDDYVDFCKKLGRDPEKPYSGSFLVRMSPEEHRSLARAAAEKGCSINAYVKDAVSCAIDPITSASAAHPSSPEVPPHTRGRSTARRPTQ